MAKFVIAPHMRLHEWVAEEKGYFRDEGRCPSRMGCFSTGWNC